MQTVSCVFYHLKIEREIVITLKQERIYEVCSKLYFCLSALINASSNSVQPALV